MQNNNCDGSGPCDTGEVRVLPTGGDSNAILCRRCFNREMNFRRERNRELAKDCRFQLPEWSTLKVYGHWMPTTFITKTNSNEMKTKYAVCSKLAGPDFELIEAWSKNEAKRIYWKRHPRLKWKEIQASESD